MIPARKGLKAAYRMKSTEYRSGAPIDAVRKGWVGERSVELQPGEHITIQQPVEAWSDDGEPMVIDDQTGKLIEATSYNNFLGVCMSDNEDPVQLMPALGWRVWRIDEKGEPWFATLVAWALCADGSIFPMETDDNGDVQKLDRSLCGDDYVIRHESEGTPDAWVQAQKANIDGAQSAPPAVAS